MDSCTRRERTEARAQRGRAIEMHGGGAADEGEPELPLYIEDEEEEVAASAAAAAEREKRREEGANWGPDKITEKFLERYHHYQQRLRERKAKSPMVRPLPRLDPEEESPEGPMRHLALTLGGPQLASSANILSIKVVRSTIIGYPMDLYGTVIVRDELDCKCIYLFRRDRDNCQRIRSKDESLTLTGPYRGLVVFNNIYFEIDLKSKKDHHQAINDDDIPLGKWFLKDKAVASTSSSKPIRNRFTSKSCAVDLTYAPANRAVEVAAQVKITDILRVREKPDGSTVAEWLPFNKKRKEHSEFHGSIATRIDGFPEDIILYDSKAAGCVISVGDGGFVELSRRVVAVPIDRMVAFKIASADDGICVVDVFPKINGRWSEEKTCGSYRLEILLVWSALFSPKDDGFPSCMALYTGAGAGEAESCGPVGGN